MNESQIWPYWDDIMSENETWCAFIVIDCLHSSKMWTIQQGQPIGNKACILQIATE